MYLIQFHLTKQIGFCVSKSIKTTKLVQASTIACSSSAMLEQHGSISTRSIWSKWPNKNVEFGLVCVKESCRYSASVLSRWRRVRWPTRITDEWHSLFDLLNQAGISCTLNSAHTTCQVHTGWQWRRLHRTRGEYAPRLVKMPVHGRGAPWVEEQQTRNWPNCTDHHQSAHQNDWLYF